MNDGMTAGRRGGAVWLAAYCAAVFAMLCAPFALARVFPGAAATETAATAADTVEEPAPDGADAEAVEPMGGDGAEMGGGAEPGDVDAGTGDAVGGGFGIERIRTLAAAFEKGFGLRRQLIAFDAGIRSTLFGESSNARVTLGRDGWLFLSETVDPRSAANAYSDHLLYRLSRTLALTREYLSANGVDFLLAVAPNKATVYSEHLPYYAKPPLSADDTLLSRLHGLLRESDIPYIDLADVLMRAKDVAGDSVTDGAALYHRLDTHWNNLGAMAVYRALMSRIAPEAEGRDSGASGGAQTAYDTYEDLAASSEDDWRADLDRMLNPGSTRLDIQYYYPVDRDFSTQKPLVNMNDMEIISESERNGKKLLMFRDSFANALIPLLSNNFGEAAYARALPYPVSRAVSRGYDHVVLEIIERNLPMVVQTAPVLSAPLRDNLMKSNDIPVAMLYPTVDAEAEASIYGSLDRLCGFFDPSAVDDSPAAVYALLTPSDGDTDSSGGVLEVSASAAPAFDLGSTLVFEAFPILDPDMRERAEARYGDAASDAGFTLYIDAFEIPEGTYDVRLMILPMEVSAVADAAALAHPMSPGAPRLTGSVMKYVNPMDSGD